MPGYFPRVIEPRWQQFWAEQQTFRTPDLPSTAGARKFYILDMFPYPSGSGLHVGHPEGYTATDILARYRRMCGWHVMHPMGWDAFGLPAEEHARKTGEHPRTNTEKNIATFKRQIQMLGFSYDWQREVDTTDPDYVKWTQWIFLQIFDTWYDVAQKRGRPIAELPIPAEVHAEGEDAVRRYQDKHRLAYQAEVPVNWCPELGTVLANEEVIDGKSEVGGHPVERRPLRQWLMRITAYAERLLDDLERVDWSESIKKMQRDWIGKSDGAEIDFPIVGRAEKIRVFTTRPDTLFGATYMVLSPEHALVDQITTPEQRKAVADYKAAAARKSDMERTELAKTKTGVFTGAFAINPANQKQIPVWIADYVLATYGTGAIMAVPGQDERDWEFAEVYNLPIIRTVQPPPDWSGKAFIEDGPAINSDFLNGLNVADAKQKMIAHLEAHGLGVRKVNYKLRDWLFSRQRYWGEPFPILHQLDASGKPAGLMRALTEKDLPLRLPDLEDFKPTGSPEGPLAKAKDWLTVTIDGKKYQRETNTMPQWAGSCWYYIRYLDPKNSQRFCEPNKAKYWLPVDLYVGGAEHAVLHLLYARFWHKVLFDRGHVYCPEPFQKLVNQGMILGETQYHVDPNVARKYSEVLAAQKIEVVSIKSDEGDDALLMNFPPPGVDKKTNLSEEQVEKKKGTVYLRGTDLALTGRADKMSKSRGNVVNPDDVVDKYGADALRLYEMFMGPLDATKPWSMNGVEGVYRFLSRVWRLIIDDRSDTVRLNESVQDVEPERETLRALHRTIRRVTDDLDGMRFNTAISAMMEFSNHLTPLTVRPRKVLEPFVLLLAPFAPHLGEELWRTLGHQKSLTYEPWPKFDPELVKSVEVEVPIQVNGKLRATLTVPAGTDDDTLRSLALADEKIKTFTAGKEVARIIVAKGKSTLVNIVVKA